MKTIKKVRTPVIKIKIVPEYHDTDFDGVPNYRDCQPFNPNKQDKKIRRKKGEIFNLFGKERSFEEYEDVIMDESSFYLFGKERSIKKEV